MKPPARPARPPSASRRRFLAGTGAVLSVGFLPGCASLPVIPKRPAPDVETGLSWISHRDGRYTLTVPRVEMGQNILTALKQVACDELGVDWSRVEARTYGTASIRRVRATVGSESVMDFALPLAQACATLREAIASGQVSGRLRAVDHPRETLRSLSGRGTWIGRSPPLEQGLEIVTGRPLFAGDVRLDGMVYGRVLRAPVPPEIASRAAALDEAAARQVPGFVALVRSDLLLYGHSLGVGIVARTPGALDRIEQALQVRWQVEGEAGADAIAAAIDIDRRLASGRRRDKYVHDDAIPDGRWDVDLRFDIPLAAHAPMEPRVAVAAPRAAGGLELWVGSQDIFYQRDVVCRRLGLSEDEVVVHGCRTGGAFGGKTICMVELEAAVLAFQVKLPVKVQWTRAQEFTQAFHRPPSSHRVRARVGQGRLQHWSHDFASSHVLFTGAVVPPWLQKLTDFIGDDGVARGAALPYRAQAWRTGFDLVRLPVHTGPWRGLGTGPNGFVIESVIDECARVAGADPVAFRLAHLVDPRLRRVVERAVATAPPPPPTPSAPGLMRGRGLACGTFKETSHAAVIADVEVDPATGEVRVLQMHCAHDCGRVINPDQVRAQCEGNLVWGVGMVLVEAWVPGVRNFGESPIPRIAQVPVLSVEIVDAGDPSSGAGETAIVASGGAIANAIRAATGWRATRLPVRPQDVLAGLRPRA